MFSVSLSKSPSTSDSPGKLTASQNVSLIAECSEHFGKVELFSTQGNSDVQYTFFKSNRRKKYQQSDEGNFIVKHSETRCRGEFDDVH